MGRRGGEGRGGEGGGWGGVKRMRGRWWGEGGPDSGWWEGIGMVGGGCECGELH